MSALFAAACGGSAAIVPAAGAQEMSRAVVDPYLGAEAALASDRIDGVTAKAGAISSAAGALGPSARAVETAAARLAAAQDIGDARVKFGALSEAIDGYMAIQHFVPPVGVRVAFCPMAMRPWLQRDGDIKNPYYGSQMLTCGGFRN